MARFQVVSRGKSPLQKESDHSQGRLSCFDRRGILKPRWPNLRRRECFHPLRTHSNVFAEMGKKYERRSWPAVVFLWCHYRHAPQSGRGRLQLALRGQYPRQPTHAPCRAGLELPRPSLRRQCGRSGASGPGHSQPLRGSGGAVSRAGGGPEAPALFNARQPRRGRQAK